MITATWEHKTGKYKYNIYYNNKRAFLQAYSSTKHSTLDHAVDDKLVTVIRPQNIEEYRKLN